MPADDRMLASSYRFEINKGNPNTMRAKQQAKISKYEESNDKIFEMDKIQRQAYGTTWNYQFESQNRMFQQKQEKKSDSQELRILKRATMMVRREALKQLYLNDLRVYENELNAKGFSIHIERI